MNDAETMLRLQRKITENDQSAYRQLFIMYYDKLLRFVMVFARNKELSEEIVSDVFINIWRRRAKIGDIENLIIQKSLAKTHGIEKTESKKPETIFSIEKINYLPEKNIILETAWVDNRLEFRSEPFQDVAKKMERWYDVSISFTSKKMEEKILTGSFETETLEEALEALKIVASFHYRIDGKKIIIKP